MPRYLFTILALLIFVLTFVSERSGYFLTRVSPETKLVAHRETQRVTVGRSYDGALIIREIASAPSVPIQARYANHLRTLRAYVAPNHSGLPTIYIESARPHNVYVLEGAFTVLPEDASLFWTTTTTLTFYGKQEDGTLTRFTIDVHDLSLASEAVAEIPTHDDRPVFDSNI